jgi:replicative DNA helicase
MSQEPSIRDLVDAPPPHDLDSEKQVIASCIIDMQKIDIVSQIIRPEDFHQPAYQTIWRAIIDCIEAGPFDAEVLASYLRQTKQWEAIGGAATLVEIIRSAATAAHAVFHANRVRDLARRRSLIDAATATIQDALDESDTGQVLDRAASRVYHVTDEDNRGESNLVELSEGIDAGVARAHATRRPTDLVGIDTGIRWLNQQTGGLRRGTMTTLGARPGQGKTALGLSIARAAASSGRSVLVFSLEMSQEDLIDRMLSQESRVSLWRMRNMNLSQEERYHIQEAAGHLSRRRIWTDDSARSNATIMGSAIRRCSRRHPLDLVIVDYLQLVDPENTRDSRHEQIGKITRRIRQLAREHNFALLVLAQVNRGSGDEGRAPKLSELRESGSIEQDSDMVLFCHRPSTYNPPRDAAGNVIVGADENDAELHIAKQRNGPIGKHTLTFRTELALYEQTADGQRAQAEEDV